MSCGMNPPCAQGVKALTPLRGALRGRAVISPLKQLVFYLRCAGVSGLKMLYMNFFRITSINVLCDKCDGKRMGLYGFCVDSCIVKHVKCSYLRNNTILREKY